MTSNCWKPPGVQRKVLFLDIYPLFSPSLVYRSSFVSSVQQKPSTMGTVDAASRFGQLALTVCSLFSFIGRFLSSTVKFIFNMTLHKVFKYTLMVLASVLCLSSVALLGLGIWLNKHPGVELVILGHSTKCLEYVCIGVAIAGIVLSLIGLFGGHREHRLLLALYCIMVPLLVFTPFLMGGPLAVVYKDNMEMLIRGETKMELKHLYGTPTHEDFTNDWDKAMKLFQCCGAVSYSDFEGSMFQNLTGLLFPQACLPQDSKVPFKEGCVEMVMNFLDRHHKATFITTLVLCACVLLSVVVSAIFHHLVQKKEKKQKEAFLNGEELKNLAKA